MKMSDKFWQDFWYETDKQTLERLAEQQKEIEKMPHSEYRPEAIGPKTVAAWNKAAEKLTGLGFSPEQLSRLIQISASTRAFLRDKDDDGMSERLLVDNIEDMLAENLSTESCLQLMASRTAFGD